MPTKLKVYTNEDDALLFWRVDKPIQDCRGFAIERKIKKMGQQETTQDFLANRTGFADQKPTGTAKAGQAVVLKPSTEWPFQRFSWTDHDANTGDTVAYRVIPVLRKAVKLQLDENEASVFSAAVTLGANKGGMFQPFFNRGFVMSQFMARFLKEKKLTLKQFKDSISAADDKTIRLFLSGDLRKALLDQLETASRENAEVFAALFELSDSELIAALAKLGKKAHVVLANGSITPKTGEGSANARKRDENEKARAKLIQAKVDVEEENRFISPGALGHNKFLVRCNPAGKPVVAWTGSTNWAPTGLCTQVNNGILINDAKVAQIYRDQWDRLRAAGSEFPPALVASNSKPKVVQNGGVKTTIWFTRTTGKVDLAALDAAVMQAKQGVLFLMFMPGSAGLFNTVSKLVNDPKLYVRGVVSTLPNSRGDESSVEVSLVDEQNHTPMHLDIIQPQGIAHPFANFAEEVVRKQFLSQVGHAIIHSKIVVVDPFSSNPIVITGSHNFSMSASASNDENFVIVEGDKDLAEAYAVNIEGAYAHYRFRAFLEQTNKPFNGLQDDDKWMAPRLKAADRELKFFNLP